MASANVLRTIFTYPISGLGPYTIAFDYLARKFVQVTLLGPDRKLLVLGTDYRFISTKQLQLINAAPAGYGQIEIRRYTDAQDRLVDFQDGSILRATDLNVSQVQTMHIAEEGRDVAGNTLGVDSGGNLDARLRKMVNLLDGVLDGDAVTIRQMKTWSESALNQAGIAKQQADAASASASSAKTSETNSKTSENNSKTSETNAANYAASALESKGAAANSASSAANSAGQAASSASAAQNSETAAAASAITAADEAAKLTDMNEFAGALSGSKSAGFLLDANFKSVGNLETNGAFNIRSLDDATAIAFSIAADGNLKVNRSSSTLGVDWGGAPNVNFGQIGFSSIAAARQSANNMGIVGSVSIIRLPYASGELMILSGSSVVSSNSSGDVSVGFPLSFSTVSTVLVSNGDSNAHGGGWEVLNFRVGGFDARARQYGGATPPAGPKRLNWIAMGVR